MVLLYCYCCCYYLPSFLHSFLHPLVHTLLSSLALICMLLPSLLLLTCWFVFLLHISLLISTHIIISIGRLEGLTVIASYIIIHCLCIHFCLHFKGLLFCSVFLFTVVSSRVGPIQDNLTDFSNISIGGNYGKMVTADKLTDLSNIFTSDAITVCNAANV